jgi:histidinol-phosphatase (PHP family)
LTATDYHMHLERGPWTLEWLRRFVAIARDRGLSEIGFSEHPHRFREWRAMYPQEVPPWVDERCTERLDSYVRLIEEARRAGLPVKIGIEWDFIPGREAQIERALRAYPWDYAIGSIHWLPPDKSGGQWWDFDNPSRAAAWEDRDVLDAYRRYFRLLAEAARTRLFDFIGHADVIKVCGYRPAEDITDMYDEAAAAFAAAGVSAEINTAGWRKPVSEVYPAPPFLQAWRRAGVPILINSDAHVPEDVGRDFDRAVVFARKAGYTEVATFSSRTRQMIPIA